MKPDICSVAGESSDYILVTIGNLVKGVKFYFASSEVILGKGVFSDLLISLRLFSVSWLIVELFYYIGNIYSTLLLCLLEFFGESKILFSLLFSLVPDRKLGPGIWLI